MIQQPTQDVRRAPATHRARRHRAGFTLIEAALTTMIVGIGLVATLQLLAAGTSANIDGTNTTTGVNLARNVRELTLKSTFAEVRALNGDVHNPPVDSRGTTIAGFNNWTQSIVVQPVDPDRLNTVIIDPDPDVVRVTARVHNNGSYVCELTWYRFRPMP
jgi:type II secretory pathway pseudopilin PulG